MKVSKTMVAGAILGAMLSIPAYGWNIGGANKAHVRICAVDEDRNPVEGVEVEARLNYGRGKVLKYTTGKDGIVSFHEKIGSCAMCEFKLDEAKFYSFSTRFWPGQSGSVVTGVVKRIVNGARMVDVGVYWKVTNMVERIGVDLFLGEPMPPYGKGRHADMYLRTRWWKDNDVMTDMERNKYYSEYWLERGETQSEFYIVEKDIECGLETPTMVRDTQRGNADMKFQIDARPNRKRSGDIGEKYCVLLKLVRPEGVFYGVVTSGYFCVACFGSACKLWYSINPIPGDRCIAWEGGGVTDKRDWTNYLETIYAKEEAAKGRAADERRLDVEQVERNREMMRRKAYSGKWSCGAWGADDASFDFDANGFGYFNIVASKRPFLDHRASGWFHWTADESGEITAHAVTREYEVLDFRLKYDPERNAMVPDLKSGLFAGRVAPLPSNPRCELGFVPGDDPLADASSHPWRVLAWQRPDIAEYDARVKSMPRRTVRSLGELWDLAAEKGRENVCIMLRTVGAPDIGVSMSGDGVEIRVTGDITRSGDADAPSFEKLKGRSGPDIRGKKRSELFVDYRMFRELVESLGGEMNMDVLYEEGAWTREKRRTLVAKFKRGQEKKCRKLLKDLAEKWYAFPARVIELDMKKDE